MKANIETVTRLAGSLRGMVRHWRPAVPLAMALGFYLTGCTTCDQFLCFREQGHRNQREFREFLDHVEALPPLDPFWIGQSTNRPEQSMEKDIRDLRRANLEGLRRLHE